VLLNTIRHFGHGIQPEREILSHYLASVLIWAPGNPADLQAREEEADTTGIGAGVQGMGKQVKLYAAGETAG
jgi:hypothetical protein